VTRVYLGDVPKDLGRRELEEEFGRVGPVVAVQVHTDTSHPYAFVEYDHPRDAEEAVRRFHGRSVFGPKRIRVELTKGARDRVRDKDTVGGNAHSGTQKRTDFRVLVLGLSAETQWQDVKDFGRPVRSSHHFSSPSLFSHLAFFFSPSSSRTLLPAFFFPSYLCALQAGVVNFSAAKDTTDGGRAGILEYSDQESMDKALATLVRTHTHTHIHTAFSPPPIVFSLTRMLIFFLPLFPPFLRMA